MDNPPPVVLPVCCGTGVPEKALTAGLLTTGASGAAVSETRTFRTVTSQPQELARWLQQSGCRHVARESAGVYCKPVSSVLEPAGLGVVLVNARHVKNVPPSLQATYHRVAGRLSPQDAAHKIIEG